MDCVFIGYALNSSAYRFFVYRSVIPDIHKNTIMESRNASFFENALSCRLQEGIQSSMEEVE